MIVLDGHLLELELQDGMAVVHEYDPGDVTAGPRATPIRFKASDSGHRLSADLPGVDPNLFITDEQSRITDG